MESTFRFYVVDGSEFGIDIVLIRYSSSGLFTYLQTFGKWENLDELYFVGV